MTFRQIDSPLVGQTRAYMPRGYSPYAPAQGTIYPESYVLLTGDIVTIESAWIRDYLPTDAPTVYYVLSHTTGKRTHVTETELIKVP